MTDLTPADLVERSKEAHERERRLIGGLTEEQVRAESALPDWSRGHVLGSRIAFVRAAERQIDYMLKGQTIELFDGGRPGRDAEIQAHAHRPASELIRAVQLATGALDDGWSRLSPSDWARPVAYRGGTVLNVLQAAWRECELHCVDLRLGLLPSAWSRELCLQLFEFLEPRVPDGVQLELTTPDGETWRLGQGERNAIHGSLTDLAAWLAGREPAGTVKSSTGTLPVLQRLRDAKPRNA
jgi:maleylpyruvate isomerase